MMKKIAFAFTVILVTLTISPRAQELPQGPGPALEWLKGLVLEARFQLQLDGSFETVRLFHERQPDGRPWVQVLGDELGGAGDWALADEAVMVMLAEANAMRALAADNAGTADQAKFVSARRAYLEAAATLLASFKGASNAVYDNTLGLIPNPLGIPDWALPGEIQIKEIAGSARLNVDTLEFGGRSSGEIALPKFDANFVVPNASFDSRGNIDLSAYGTATFPPDSADQVTLSILQRRPLTLQLSENGSFRAAGSARVTIPGGNTFEAYFDADDPNYEFGLAYSGSLTLDLAEEITLIRPMIPADPSFEALEGLAAFYGSFGRGLETFLEASPDFPSLQDLEVGVAPDFVAPVTTVPLDVIDAWIVSANNDAVRPLVNGSFDASLDEVNNVFQALGKEIASAQREVAPTLNEVRRLKRHAAKVREVTEIIARSRDEALLGNDEKVNALFAEAEAVAVEAEEIAVEYLSTLPADASLELVADAVRLWISADRMSSTLSMEDTAFDSEVLTLVRQRLDGALEQHLAENGLGPEAQIVDAQKFAKLTPVDLRVLFRSAVEVDRIRAALSHEDEISGLTMPPITVLLRLEFENVSARYSQAIAENDQGARAQHAVRLADLAQVNEVITFTNTPAERQLMIGALHETVSAVGNSPEAQKLAGRLVEAARNHHELENEMTQRRVDRLLGRDDEKSLPERLEFDGLDRPFFQRWYTVIKGAADSGIIDNTLAGEMELSLAGVMRAFAADQTQRFADGDVVESNLTEAYDALLILTDLLAIAEDMVPGNTVVLGELQASWQALHIQWVLVAEGKKMHWHLSAYARAVAEAAGRYGTGVEGALAEAFQTNGTAALDALALIVEDMSNRVSGLGTEPFQFALPGDLEVERMFGSLRFNRVTGEWDVDFGGRLFFKDYDLTFEIPFASLESDGDFELSLNTAGPVPFGFGENLSLTTAFTLSGNALTPALDMASAMGDLFYTPEGGQPIPYTMDLMYAFEDPPGSHNFNIEAGLGGPQEFFTKDIIITDTSINFALSTDADGIPRQGGAGGDTTLWLLLREESENKEVSALTEDDFYLTFKGAAAFVFSNENPRFVEVQLTSGELHLPGELFSDAADPNASPKGELLGTICVRYEFDTGQIRFCDLEGNEAPGIALSNFIFDIPGLEGGEVGMDQATLRFPLDAPFPILEQLTAHITLPIPGQDTSEGESSATVNIDVQNWPITGLPENVSISLEEPLTLFDFEQFQVRVLANAGAVFEDCPAGLSFLHNPDTGQTIFRIASGIEVAIASEMIAEEENEGTLTALSASASGCFMWEIGQLPSFELGSIAFAGSFRLGGENGIEFKGSDGDGQATVVLSNINNLFQRPPANPGNSFRIDLDGAVNFADFIEFGLIDSAFIWDGTAVNPLTGQVDNRLPRFEPGGVCAMVGEEGIDLIEGLLPLYPTQLCLRFVDGSRPLFPTGNETGLFDPLNLIVNASGVVTLPNGAAVEGGSPGLSGAVEGIEIMFQQDPLTGLPVPNLPATIASIDGITLRIENLDIPPLGGITGGLHLGNLDRVVAGFPEELFFAGEVGAKVSDIGAEVLLAAKPLEFVGACFSLSAGPAGIPIDGGYLGGVLLTGGSGGINFKNSYSNPCDFAEYITFGQNPAGEMVPETLEFDDIPTGESPPNMEELATGIEMDLAMQPVTANEILDGPLPCVFPTTPDFNCITGPFPPPTINPLCEKITINGQNRIIFKGTSLNETQVLDLLELAFPNVGRANLRAHLDSLSPGQIIDNFIAQSLGSVQQTVNTIINGDPDLDGIMEFDPNIIDPRAHALFSKKINEIFASFDDAARNFLREGFHRILKIDPDASLYDILLQKAAEGIPCFDVTLRLEGTLSHSAISSVLSGTGAVTLSSTGTAVLDGSINLVGIPVGTGTLAFSLTNENGNIDPSFGGVAEVALGPLELGRMTMSLACTGCYDAITVALENWVNTNAFALGADVRAFLIGMMDVAAPIREAGSGDLIPRDPNGNLMNLFDAMSEEEKFAWMTSFFNVLQIVADNPSADAAAQPLPVLLSSQTLNTFVDSFSVLLVEILTQVNPRICFGGDIGPKIFGFPLTGGADGALGGGLLYHRVGDRQQVVSQIQFSPSQMLSSLVLGSYAFVLPTAIDQSQMGYSFEMEAFTPENIKTLLTEPATFAANQLTSLVETAVLSFGYQMQPLGYQLGNGQGRMIMPRITSHPLNPAVLNSAEPWTNPDEANDPDIPTRMELILAALSKGQMQNPLWRGTGPDLASLFALEGDCYQPSSAGCDLLTQEVGMRVDPNRLLELDMAVDYFPHGGLIGGADLALPNMIAKTPPYDMLAQLLTIPTADTLGDWMDNAQILFGDPSKTDHEDFNEPGYAYFTGTLCSGQMAFYLPAPNPLGFEWADASLEDFIRLVQNADVEAIINRTVPDNFYEKDLIMLRGWLDAPMFGLPVARGLIDYAPEDGCFTMSAEVLNEIQVEDEEGGGPVPNWLYDLVGASMNFQIKAPEAIENTAGPDEVQTGNTLERLKDFGDELTANGENFTLTQATEFLADLQQSMPKVSAEVQANFQLPGELGDLMRVTHNPDTLEAELGFFAFSPAFEPDFELENHSPYALAKRRGGMGLTGSFQVGYFPANVLINLPNASMAMFPSDDITAFPAIAAAFEDVSVSLPSYSFNDGAISTFEFGGDLGFNTDPDIGGHYVEIAGGMSEIDLGPFLHVTPLEGDQLGGSLYVTRTADGAAVGLELNPAQANIPLFGSLTGTIHGGSLDHEKLDTNEILDVQAGLDERKRFTFSTYEGQPWSAVVQLDGALEIRHPFDLDEIIFQAEPVVQDRVQIPFLAQIEGTGLESFEIRLTIPNGLTFTLFPGTAHASTYTVGSNSATCLLVNSEGRIYFDSGTRSLDLAGGLGEIEGRIELGFEPQGSVPILAHSDPKPLSASLGVSEDIVISVSNGNSNPSQLVVDATLNDATHFSVFPTRLVLGARETADLTVRFAPKAVDFAQPVLRLANNSNSPLVEIPLQGEVISQPRVHVHLSSIDFGLTPMGTPRSHTLRVTNTGDAVLHGANLVADGAPFSIDQTSLTIPPSQWRDVQVTYVPTSTSVQSGEFRFDTDDPKRPLERVSLSGQGSDRFWYRQRRGTGDESLQGIAMLPDGHGHALGLVGAHLGGDAGGLTWLKDPLVDHPDIHAAVALSHTTMWIVGATRPIKGDFSGFVARTTNGGASWQRQSALHLAGTQATWHALTALPESGFLAFAGATPDGAIIVMQTGTDAYSRPVLDAKARPLHGIAFGSALVGLAVGEDRTILRTLDGGKTWAIRSNFPKDLPSSTDLLAIAANPFDKERFIVVGENGTILGTADNGDSWALVKSGVEEDLHGVLRAGEDRYFIVGHQGRILRGNKDGTEWSPEDARTDTDFRAVTAIDAGKTSVSPQVWAVTAQGDIFHRRTSPISGPIAVVEADDLTIRAGEGEKVIRVVHVSNQGTEELEIGLVVSGNGIEVIPKDSQTLTAGEANTFVVRIDAKSTGMISGSIGFKSDDDGLDKVSIPVNVDVRDPFFLPLGYALLPGRLDLGVVLASDNVGGGIVLENIGQAPITLHNVDIAHNYDDAQFQVERSGSGSIAPGGKEEFKINFTATQPGEYTGLLEVASDASNGMAFMEVRARVTEEPQTVIVGTNPPGLNFLLDNNGNGTLNNYGTTTVFTVVDGAPANTLQLRRGTSISVEALPEADRNGMHWQFQRWRPGGAREFSFIAGQSAGSFTAEYATGPAAGPVVEVPPLLVASPCVFRQPNDVTFGPWVRITEARLTLPWLGDGAGTDFHVEGSFFMSLDRAYGSLTSSRVRVSAPDLQNIEVLEVTPSSWSVDIESRGNGEGTFALGALSPGIQVLNASALPPAELSIGVELFAAARRASLSFATLDELPLAPGLLALGPGEVVFETNVSTSQADLFLSVEGSIRALANPLAPAQWMINQPYTFELAAEIGEVTFTEPTQLVDLGLVRIHADQASSIRPVFNAPFFGIVAENLDLEFFRNETFVPVSGSLEPHGGFRFAAGIPENGVPAGPVVIQAGDIDNNDIVVEAKPLEARLAIEFPPMQLNSIDGLWPDHAVKTTESLLFDTSQMTVRLPLPGFQFAGFAMTDEPDLDAHHYIEFSRTSSAAAVRLRNRQELFLGRLKFAFDMNTSGKLSGLLSGTIGVAEPPPIDGFSDSVSMSYDRDRDPEFLAHRSFFSLGLRFKVGTGNPISAQACTLHNGSPDPMAKWEENVCVP